MGNSIYARADIRATLVALAVQSVAVYAANEQRNAEYIRGTLDTIRAVGLAHQCRWPDVFADIRANVAPGYLGILDAAAAELPSGVAFLKS